MLGFSKYQMYLLKYKFKSAGEKHLYILVVRVHLSLDGHYLRGGHFSIKI